jgi:hypothetical protein
MNIKRKKTKFSLVCLASFYLLLLSILSCTESSTKPEVYEPGIIKMVTTANEVKIRVNGIGKVIIYWGSGATNQKYDVTLNNGSINSSPVFYIDLYNDVECNIIVEGHINYFETSGNELTHLDVSGMPSLLRLRCNKNLITELDVSKNKLLEQLLCSDNLLKDLNVRENRELRILQVSENKLSSLDVSQNKFLEVLDFTFNRLTNIELNNCISLTYLFCDYNLLEDLDIRNNTRIIQFNVKNNSINKIDIGTNSILRVNVYNNNLDSEALNDIFRSLNDINDTALRYDQGYVNIGDNIGKDDCDRNIAEDKGWIIHDYYYPVSDNYTDNFIKEYKYIWRKNEKGNN